MIVFDYEIVSVYCRNDVNAVIDCANNVFTWGRGNNNMLGHNNSFRVNRPKEVKFLSGTFIYIQYIYYMCVCIICIKIKLFLKNRETSYVSFFSR